MSSLDAAPVSGMPSPIRAVCNTAVFVAALGYFVDVFDLVLFSVVRTPSLTALGLSSEEITSAGVYLLNMQMIGMLVGGIVFGVLGDKKGRLSVLFGSILLYSLANIANGFVDSVQGYAILRFLAGVGLAGELGGGITLVSEILPKETRGYATTMVATIGVAGAIAAALVGDLIDWRTAYMVGGVLGLCLLFLRVAVKESGMFDAIRDSSEVSRGDVRLLFCSWSRFVRYMSCIAIGIPIWFVVAITVTFCPEIGRDLGLSGPLHVSTAVICCYVGITIGDLASGLLSQLLRSRKRAILSFQLLALTGSIVLLLGSGRSPEYYYTVLGFVGLGAGYWAVLLTTAAEQFGTNVRATVATTVPNFIRGSTVLATLLFESLKGSYGAAQSAGIVGGLWFAIAIAALFTLRETFHQDLNFLECRRG